MLKYYYCSVWIFNAAIAGIYLVSLVMNNELAVNITYAMFDVGIAM